MFNGKMKAVTFSYDDAVTQDQRLIHLFNKYGLKCTFNINYDNLGVARSIIRNNVTVAHCKPQPYEVPGIYAGHEVAGHTLTHPGLPSIADDNEVIRQVEEDRLRLSELVGYEVVGFAYPGGGRPLYDDRVAELIKNNTGVRYARTTTSTLDFDTQTDLYRFKPTVYHHRQWDEMLELGEKFLSLEADEKKVFYVWGHAYEFDIHNSWDRFEEFLKMMSGRQDILYLTNKEALL